MSIIDKLNQFWDELKDRNVVRAFVFYCVTAWLIIQFATTTFPYLNFPDWAITVVIYASFIGAPIVVIVSWVYEMTTDGLKKTDDLKEEASPTVQPVNTSKVLNRLTIGVLVVAVSFLLVDKFVLSSSTPTTSLSGKAIAIFPFTIQGGEDVQYLKTGMPDIITNRLDAIPGMNATDPNILFSTVEKMGFDNRDPKEAAQIAEKLGANRVVLGSLTQLGEKIQVRMSKYDNLGNAVGQTIIEEGTFSELYGSASELVRRLVAEELEEQGSEFESSAILTTEKIESIIPFLKGQQQRRQGQFKEAVDSFKEAIENDTTFTLAYRAYLESAGWVNDLRIINRATDFFPYQQKLKELAPTLSGKQRELVEAEVQFIDGEVESINTFKNILKKYGESRETLAGLGEAIFHLNSVSGGDIMEAKPYFDRLIEIDPNNEEYLIHRLDLASFEDDLEKYEELLEYQGEATQDSLKRVFGWLTLKDTVYDDEVKLFREALEKNIPDQLFQGRREDFYSSVQLIGRILEGSNDLKSQFGVDHARALKGLSGNHEDLIEELMVYFVESENIELGLMQWGINSGYNENPNTQGDDKELIELHNTFLEYGIGEPYDALTLYAISMSRLNLKNDQALDKMLSDFQIKISSEEKFAFGELSVLYRLMFYNIMGMRSYYSQDFDKTEVYFDSAVHHVKGVSYEITQNFSRSRNIFIAENLLRQKKLNEALGYYKSLIRSLNNGYVSAGSTWGFIMFRIGQVSDQLGEDEEAMEYYKKFLDAYKNADQRYQPWVTEARQRLQALKGSS